MTPEQKAEHDEKLLREFNERHPVGSKIWFWWSLPNGNVTETTIRSEAFVASSDELVCFLAGVSGYVSIWHIQAIDESRRADLNFVEPRA